MSSRVIVKNLPAHATEQRLKELFAAAGEVTDCRLKTTKAGRSRNFGFVGFRQESEAAEAVKQLNKSFFDTARLSVELAFAPGSEQISRPWSRYAAGSSAHEKEQGAQKDGAEAADEKKKKAAKEKAEKETQKAGAAARKKAMLAAGKKAKKIETAAVKSTKAGVSANRVHMEFDTSDEDDVAEPKEVKEVIPVRDTTDSAFDDDLDDLAYLRKKTSAAPLEEAAVPPQESPEKEEEETGGKKKKKKLKKRPAAAAALSDDDGDGKLDAATPGAPEAAAAAEEKQDADFAGDNNLEDPSERLYVTNIPYGTTEDELQKHFAKLGEVSSIWLCKEEDTLKSRGFGYVTYVFPESAVRARAELDMKSFQGRMLRIASAKSRPEPEIKEVVGQTKGSTYKKKLQERKKRVDAHLEHTWNLLYVSSSAATDAASAQLGVKKSELIGKDAENAALTAALAETSVIQQTKQWLRREGIRVDAFEQTGASLAQSKAIESQTGKRRDDTFIVKHLPAGARDDELRERFSKFGEMVRCSLAPAGTVAIVQYTDKEHAKRAFQKTAFSRYRTVPLYLEWAPDDVFSGDRVTDENTSSNAKGVDDENDDDEENAAAPQGCLFVKNLNFSTTDAVLKSAFSGCKGFRTATVMRKKAAVSKDSEGKEALGLSMGYGFVEFDTPDNAKEAIKRKQNIVVENHTLTLQVSNRREQQGGGGGRSAQVKKKAVVNSERLCVRNLAFETTRKELSKLFGAYGSVTAVRLPKKADYTGHRGFAFVDFASKSEAASAFEALQHTHLYGRRMVIEPAEVTKTDVGSVQEAAQKRQAAQELKSESKRRKQSGVLNTSSGGGDSATFKEAFT